MAVRVHSVARHAIVSFTVQPTMLVFASQMRAIPQLNRYNNGALIAPVVAYLI
jgi:hypothetical protein